VKRVLVFDSGVGGLSVLDAIIAAGAALEIDYVADNEWLPYGLKPEAALRARVPALLAAAAQQGRPDAIVIACNTASTIALDAVRSALTLPIIGVVPPIKPAAAHTQTGTIGLLATPATVSRAYTDDLIAQFAANTKVIRFGSAALVDAAERTLAGAVDMADAVDKSVRAAVDEAIAGLFGAPGGDAIDVVALACTHFPLLISELQAAAPRACVWLDSGAAIARRVVHVLAAEPGAARMNVAAFTAGDGTLACISAFRSRGFTRFVRLDASRNFAASQLPP
jgi:glutamate racemase